MEPNRIDLQNMEAKLSILENNFNKINIYNQIDKYIIAINDLFDYVMSEHIDCDCNLKKSYEKLDKIERDFIATYKIINMPFEIKNILDDDFPYITNIVINKLKDKLKDNISNRTIENENENIDLVSFDKINRWWL